MRACFGVFLKPFRFTLVGLTAIAAACSGGEVDNLFENGGASASSVTSGESTANAGNSVTSTSDTTTNAVSQTTDAAQSSTDAGEATASTQDGTTASEGTSTTEQASSSTGQPTLALPCGQIMCDLSQNQTCCLFDPLDTTECKSQCNGVEIPLECNGPGACGGHQCCARRGQFASNYERLICSDDPCGQGNDRVVCDSDADCGMNEMCEQSDLLPGGYKVCKAS